MIYYTVISGGKQEKKRVNFRPFDTLTAKDFREMMKGNSAKSWLRQFSDIPEEIISQMKKKQIKTLVSFIPYYDLGEIDVMEVKYPINVGEKSVGKFEQAKMLLKSSPQPFWCIPDLVSIYRFRDVQDDEPVFKFLGAGLNLLTSFYAHLQKFKGLNTEYTDEQIEAGVQDFESFGSFPLIDNLSKGDPLRYEEIMKLPADVVYMKLLLNVVQSDFNENLMEIRRMNNQPANGN